MQLVCRNGILHLIMSYAVDENLKKEKQQKDWLGCVLWHINPCVLFNAKSCLFISDL